MVIDGDNIAAIRNLTKTYGKPGTDVRVEALKSIDIEFRRGQWVAICGHSGSGKSTLMNVLGCLDRPTSGEYILGNLDVSGLQDNQLADIRGRYIGFVFQSFNLVQQLSLLENLEIPLFYQGVPASVRRSRAQELAELVSLADRAQHKPNELSGGQQQRAAIARALINDPLFILADEPTGNLDTATGDAILDIFENLRESGKTILMVTHEHEVAQRADRIITLRDGKILSDVYTSEAN